MRERLLISGPKLSSLRGERFLTQEELARRLGMSIAGVRRLEQIQTGGIQMRNFRRLAELAQLSPQQLHRRIGAPPPAGAHPATGAPSQPTALLPGSRQAVAEIERFHGVSAARIDERPGVERGRVPAPRGGGRRFAVVVDGDCMEPLYRNGDIVIFSIDLAEREGIIDGRNYFIQFTDGENTFKRVFIDPDDAERLLLRCWNRNYPQRAVERSRVQTLARAEYRMIPDADDAAAEPP